MGPLNITASIPEADIKKRVKEIGKEITQRFKGEEIVAICVLRGSFIFFSDLIREIEADFVCDFMGVSSYENTNSTGEVKITLDLNTSVQGKNILLVEDIVDTGLTMHYLINNLRNRNPKSITTVSLLHKPDAKKVDCEIDYVGFKISNDFVVGYGLDYNGNYRHLPYIAQVNSLN